MGTWAPVLVGHRGLHLSARSSQEVLSLLGPGACEPGQTLPLSRPSRSHSGSCRRRGSSACCLRPVRAAGVGEPSRRNPQGRPVGAHRLARPRCHRPSSRCGCERPQGAVRAAAAPWAARLLARPPEADVAWGRRLCSERGSPGSRLGVGRWLPRDKHPKVEPQPAERGRHWGVSSVTGAEETTRNHCPQRAGQTA